MSQPPMSSGHAHDNPKKREPSYSFRRYRGSYRRSAGFHTFVRIWPNWDKARELRPKWAALGRTLDCLQNWGQTWPGLAGIGPDHACGQIGCGGVSGMWAQLGGTWAIPDRKERTSGTITKSSAVPRGPGRRRPTDAYGARRRVVKHAKTSVPSCLAMSAALSMPEMAERIEFHTSLQVPPAILESSNVVQSCSGPKSFDVGPRPNFGPNQPTLVEFG